jgi:hypothetical protein
MDEHLLILHYAEGDESHLTIVDIKHQKKIVEYISQFWALDSDVKLSDDPEEVKEDMLIFIENNTIETAMYERYIPSMYLFGDYNIKQVIHLPELGE